MAKPKAAMRAKMQNAHRHTIANPKRFFTFIGIVIIVLAIVFAFAFAPSGPLVLSSFKAIVLHNGTSMLIKLNGSIFAIYVASSSSSGAVVLVSKVPVLSGYASEALLVPNSSVNVSINATGIANLNIKLAKSNSTSAELYITPLASVLGVKPSSDLSLIGPVSIGRTSGLKIIVTSTSTSSTTSTSTINQTAALLQSALAYANNNTSEGLLETEYASLYEKDKACNSSIYNETYTHYYGKAPSSDFSFLNISRQTPIGINETVAYISGTLVFVNYTPIMRSGKQSPLLSLELNMSPLTKLRIVKAAYTGILQGDNYSIVNSTYAFQSKISNYCGAYIMPPPS
ncbi:MAG: hypothetical protein ACP5MC_02900 [Candidatus Micrarchaeia archaeon]